MKLSAILFPPAYRQAAVVAFLRTFWQTVRATGLLGFGGATVVNATQLAHVDIVALAYTAGAVIVSGLIAASLAAGDILSHGLPDAYQTPATPIPPVPALIAPVTPAAPSQPAADVPPAPIAADPSFESLLTPAAEVPLVTASSWPAPLSTDATAPTPAA